MTEKPVLAMLSGKVKPGTRLYQHGIQLGTIVAVERCAGYCISPDCPGHVTVRVLPRSRGDGGWIVGEHPIDLRYQYEALFDQVDLL